MTTTPCFPQSSSAFGRRILLGILGVFLAALCAGLNSRVTEIAQADIRGVLGVGIDEGSWITGAYQAAEICSIMFSAWLIVTISLRRFAIIVSLGFAIVAMLLPFSPNLPFFITLRIAQGLFGGALPPLLLTAALRFLPPAQRLQGLGAYALTATCGPNLAVYLASLWSDVVGWQLLFWQVVPLMLGATALMAYGLPKDAPCHERFHQLDRIGFVTGCGGMAMLVLALQQGRRLDWFNSPIICILLLSALCLLIVFVINEWFHKLPLFKLQMLKRTNLVHGLISLGGAMFINTSGSALPSAYFTQVLGMRPAEFAPLALTIALPQLLIAPLIAMLCSQRWVDSRWVLACGLILIASASLMSTALTVEWARVNFYLPQIMQAFGQPMVVIAILMGSTSVVQPSEGPFASAMFNTVRSFSNVAAVAWVDTFIDYREKFHSNVIIDQIGNRTGLLDLNSINSAQSLMELTRQIKRQALVLGISDAYWIVIIIVFMLLGLLLYLPHRIFPPQKFER